MSSDSVRSALEKEYQKLSLRNDELVKQDSTLRKEYTTLLRKASSLASVLKVMDSKLAEQCEIEQPKLIGDRALKLVPGLQWYNDQINLVTQSFDNDNEEIEIPKELLDSYTLCKDTPLLYKDSQ
ncbi:hypothetical protein KAFR_0K01760 [Kazachstania africana CBS 2517]|uniref:Uncharacterized protein n=1 Tax=Kazachstania africana (strain ATCC 22294 / BCRC 22015 / CBS 2517 / CECT 1963 / NBRC 1671 / NRRL Y-8276) TaxID=1071382 RepID=H2B1N0_KAZAF|nr:hypothetical protein KAFR_0K01760 [Kazachstania africana CBS 2517]CCF60530.1 hypothetical protein KAFR_0K01760 [Kazachstania africana CBS 2517]